MQGRSQRDESGTENVPELPAEPSETRNEQNRAS